ncbi:DoxX-like family protein [Hymenobacter metallilatus]|uniref:DoxX family membrane protein n=1 Tax=Hymenobacter metallilatus TaxID=2493666 RepID=A0A428JM36_9BACT|nr:DoxX-like family protein [Hymenobacter metallilatus]RSK34031.1 hypothetical protein EI290_10030 [Hymenobacter metallilatus]
MKGSHSLVWARLLRFGIAAVWLINGLLCKVLHLVPRHEAIVARILGPTHAGLLTQSIGVAEIALGLWVLGGRNMKLTAAVQIALVLVMNVLEFWLAPDLLLWGRLNMGFAAEFAVLVYYQGFILKSD